MGEENTCIQKNPAKPVHGYNKERIGRQRTQSWQAALYAGAGQEGTSAPSAGRAAPRSASASITHYKQQYGTMRGGRSHHQCALSAPPRLWPPECAAGTNAMACLPRACLHVSPSPTANDGANDGWPSPVRVAPAAVALGHRLAWPAGHDDLHHHLITSVRQVKKVLALPSRARRAAHCGLWQPLYSVAVGLEVHDGHAGDLHGGTWRYMRAGEQGRRVSAANLHVQRASFDHVADCSLRASMHAAHPGAERPAAAACTAS